MVTSISSSSSYAIQDYAKPVTLPTLTSIQKNALEQSIKSFGNTQFQSYTPKNYFDDRHIYMQSWTADSFATATSQNLGRLKQALMGYTPKPDPIGAYTFQVTDSGIINNLPGSSDSYIRDLSGNPVSQQAILQALQAADAGGDGLISSLELQSQQKTLQQTGDTAGVSMLGNLQSQLNVVSPDQFINISVNNGVAELKVYNTDKLQSSSNSTTLTTPLGNITSTINNPLAGNSSNNNSSVPSGSEASLALNIEMIADRDKIKTLLKKADQNKDGAVTEAELQDLKNAVDTDGTQIEDSKIVESLLAKGKNGIANFHRLSTQYGNGMTIKLSDFDKEAYSWGSFIEFYRSGAGPESRGLLAVVT